MASDLPSGVGVDEHKWQASSSGKLALGRLLSLSVGLYHIQCGATSGAWWSECPRHLISDVITVVVVVLVLMVVVLVAVCSYCGNGGTFLSENIPLPAAGSFPATFSLI